MRPSVLAAGTLLLGAFTLAQGATMWEYTKKPDPLRNQTIDVFVLKGSFATAPRTGAANPSLVIACKDGKVHQNFFNFGTVVHYEGGPGTGTWAHTNLKANIDGKRTGIYANHMSEDGQAAYFTRGELKSILKAHHLAVGAKEVLGGEVIAEFDVPDPAPIFEKCGKDSAIR